MGTASCIGGDPGATACMKMKKFGVLGKGGVAGAGEGRKRPNRPTNCHKGTILRTATKALFGALVGGAFLKIRCSVVSRVGEEPWTNLPIYRRSYRQIVVTQREIVSRATVAKSAVRGGC